MLPAGSHGVHAMETVESLRAKAQQCWRLLSVTTDEQTFGALREMAIELEAAADLAAAKADPDDFLAEVTAALRPTV